MWSLEATCSNHLLIFLNLNPLICIPRSRRFRFENQWLRQANYVDVIHNSRVSSTGSPIQIQFSTYGNALLQWGGNLARDFHKRISMCKQRVSVLRGR